MRAPVDRASFFTHVLVEDEGAAFGEEATRFGTHSQSLQCALENPDRACWEEDGEGEVLRMVCARVQCEP